MGTIGRFIEKTNDWKTGEKALYRKLIDAGFSRNEALNFLDDTKEVRGWSYNRGVLVLAGAYTVCLTAKYVVVPLVKRKIAYIKLKKLYKKTMEEIEETKDEKDEEA